MKNTAYEINAGLAEPLTIVFLSDVHDVDADPIIERVKAASPDAVLVGGDYVQNKKRYENGISLLKALAELYPTFVSLGNHEFKSIPDIKKRTVQTGAVLLDDCDTTFRGVRIGGLTSGFDGRPQGTFMKTPPPDTDFLRCFDQKDGFRVLLCHHPEYYPAYLKNTGIELILSGHAHGGQWRFFGRGLFAPGQGIFPKYTSGMYDGRLIVSRGAGDSHFIPRINNERELVIIKLK